MEEGLWDGSGWVAFKCCSNWLLVGNGSRQKVQWWIQIFLTWSKWCFFKCASRVLIRINSSPQNSQSILLLHRYEWCCKAFESGKQQRHVWHSFHCCSANSACLLRIWLSIFEMCPKDNDKMDRESRYQTEMKIFEKIKKKSLKKQDWKSIYKRRETTFFKWKIQRKVVENFERWVPY